MFKPPLRICHVCDLLLIQPFFLWACMFFPPASRISQCHGTLSCILPSPFLWLVSFKAPIFPSPELSWVVWQLIVRFELRNSAFENDLLITMDSDFRKEHLFRWIGKTDSRKDHVGKAMAFKWRAFVLIG